MNFLDERLHPRFWRRVIPEPNSGCWLWTGAHDQSGYGFVRVNKVHRMAHRFAYESLVAPIADGLTIDHLCRVTCCVNPAHMEPVTLVVNILRSNGVTAINARKTHCIRNHAYTPENTGRQANGQYRYCRVCRRQTRTRERKAA